MRLPLGAGSPSRATIGAGGAGALGVSTKKGQTMNNAKTMIIGGTLVAKPFATSEKPFVKKEPVSIIYGALQCDAVVADGRLTPVLPPRHNYNMRLTPTVACTVALSHCRQG